MQATMDSRRCQSCSEPTRTRCCQCQRVPSNLEYIQKILHKPKGEKRTQKCAPCSKIKAVAEAYGDNIDCLCNCLYNDTLNSDHRLKTWEEELKLRNNIAERLMQRTGKSPCELLFNRAGTVDVRDKLMMQRLLAHAESCKPQAKHLKGVIKDQLPNGCLLKEITSAKPKRKKYFEIIGLPAGVKCELIGENCCVRRSGWIVSRTVREQIAAHSKSIKRVVPFFPDIEYLQVIGKKMTIYENAVDVVDEKKDVNNTPGATQNDISNRFDACLADNRADMEEDSISQLAYSSDKDDEKASYQIYCCCRDRINQSVEDDLLDETTSCSNNFDIYDDLIANRARCHSIFFGL